MVFMLIIQRTNNEDIFYEWQQMAPPGKKRE
jgi:hypothetical protein